MATNGDWFAARAAELHAAAAFLTRLPLGSATPADGAVIAHAAWAFPIIGAGIGLAGAAVAAFAHKFGLPPWPAAALAVVATLLLTGCLHEDGLADTADGFGGGSARERKLEIMRDSRIGAYGVCALVLSLLLRVGALASLADTAAMAWALIAAHGAARTAMVVFMALVPPARSDGLSFGAGSPPRESALVAGVLGLLLLAVCLGPMPALLAAILLAAIVALMGRLSLAQIGGQTGDVLGAVEQVSEIAILLVALR
jgi:adenosylcobinamide-GDP ribazoletransferase